MDPYASVHAASALNAESTPTRDARLLAGALAAGPLLINTVMFFAAARTDSLGRGVGTAFIRGLVPWMAVTHAVCLLFAAVAAFAFARGLSRRFAFAIRAGAFVLAGFAVAHVLRVLIGIAPFRFMQIAWRVAEPTFEVVVALAVWSAASRSHLTRITCSIVVVTACAAIVGQAFSDQTLAVITTMSGWTAWLGLCVALWSFRPRESTATTEK